MSDSIPPAETPRSSTSGANKRWEPPSPAELAALMPGYTIEKLLGKGGMGAVYQGVQENLERPVAIKIISNDLDEADASYGERFKNEAKAMAKLSHPGIVAVHDYGMTTNGILYIVMEFIEGTDVAKMIAQQKRLHTDHAMAVTAHVCDALAYAHERGIIHRDIKPANIMVGYDGVVKVADFGLAKMTQSGESGLTQSGMAMGTLHYMAPEALMLGAGVDHRADIYAVGVMLYQMLTGKVPHGMFELPSMQVPGLDPRYDAIIAKAMREDRELRYQSVQELRGDLDSILTQPVEQVDPAVEQAPAALPTTARPQRPAGQPYRPPQAQAPVYVQKKSSPLPWVAVIAVVAFAAWFLFGRTKTAPRAETVVEAPAPKIEPKADESSTMKAPATSSPAATATLSTPALAATLASKPAAPPPAGSVTATAATKDKPFVNSLGMKFVPVPITGGPSNRKLVLFSVWETRVQDYQDFAKETKRDWPKPPYEEGPTHPAVNVTWDDAQDFCTWLNERESKAGWLKPDEHYRLPSDHEWSCAVGIGEQEDATKMPKDKDMGIANVYPWGTGYPPPAGAGNYNGEEAASRNFSTQQKILAGYRDNFPAMAPVGSFKANHLGLFDLGGNAWEWCEDLFTNVEQARVLRGATFMNRSDHDLNSSFRIRDLPSIRAKDKTVRIVLASSKNAQDVATAKKASDFPPELAALDQQFIKLQAERVTAVFDADVTKLNSGYLGGLDREMAKERAAGRLDGVLALEEEKKLITAKQPVPPTDDASTNAAVKNLRNIYREAYAKLEAARLTNSKALTDPLALRLKTLEADLTKQNRIADAKAVREYREKLPEPESKVAYSATHTFTNSLGMKFVPVPGTEVLFCTTLTRIPEYNAFAAETPGVKPATEPGGEQRDLKLFPVSTLSWNNAKAFCDWLSKKEGRSYRLPTDREWSMAVGIGSQEFKNATPEELNGKIVGVYPWGSQWPPPNGVANYMDETYLAMCKANKFTPAPIIKGYTDGEVAIAPVEAFKPNKLGLHDMGGNLWQWCEDWYDAAKTQRLLRGGCWDDSSKERLLSAARWAVAPDFQELDGKSNRTSFRCVLVASSLKGGNTNTTKAAPAAPTTTTPPTSNSTPQTQPGSASVTAFTNTLGMKFVPVKDARVWFCVHETRRQDYAVFAAAVPGTDSSWKNEQIEGIPCGGDDNHPVVGVNWGDAKAFCDWLSQKEGKTYRLPTDQEWSIAVGLGRAEKWEKDTTPEMLAEKEQTEFPWGGSYPPRASNPVGNYADTIMKEKIPSSATIDGYTDGFPTTAPVMSFKPNKSGLYDMGGNVWEWVEDWWNADKAERLLRGGSWFNEGRRRLLSSGRFKDSPGRRNGNGGFRCVVEASSTGGGNSAAAKAPTAASTTTPPPAASAPPTPVAAPAGGATNTLGMEFKNVLFENSIGMKFASLPGAKALMCIHETRKSDYAAFAAENPGADVSWRTVRNQFGTLISAANDHPVVNVTWDEAQVFCAWLSKKEGKPYRLPTDREWSIAAGLGSKESTLGTPQSRHAKIKDAYPWGSTWPPPAGAGNFADTTMAAQSPNLKVLNGYTDGYATTSPVMSFAPNALGFYDLGGNAWELIDDWYNAMKKDHLMRGGAFDFGDREWLNLTARDPWSATGRLNSVGFRCVVEIPLTSPATPPAGGASVPKP